MLFQLVQIVYWLALSTWFGGVLFVAVAAPIIFRTVRESNPVLPDVLSVNLEGQHGTLLAGSIVANLLGMLSRVEIGCAAVLMLALIAQWVMVDAGHWLSSLLRCAMLIAAAVVVGYGRWHVWPRILENRQTYIDHADEPEVANPAKERFDHYHRESVTLLTVVLGLLLGMVLFSADIGSPSAGGAGRQFVFPGR
jgi:hypothetical protein